MFLLIKQVCTALLSFSRSFAARCVSLNNEPCMTSPTLVNFNLTKLNHYPFMISLNKCNRS